MARKTKTVTTERISEGKKWEVMTGDVEHLCKLLDEKSFDAVLCDPPYGLSFMGKKWDYQVPQASLWAQVLRVMKPGAPLIAFSSTRTYHRAVVQVEDGGFDVQDMFSWLYGQGWPKGLDISKGIDKKLGAKREVTGSAPKAWSGSFTPEEGYRPRSGLRHDIPVTELADAWSGYNTQLKPATEMAVVAVKPNELGGIVRQSAWAVKEATIALASIAKHADERSSSALRACDGDVDSVRWSALLECSTPDALFAAMDTWRSESGLPTSLNIAWSWLRSLGDLLDLANTCTIETTSSMIIGLKTSNSYPSKITPGSIIQAATRTTGSNSPASLVESAFSAVRAFCDVTRALSATGDVTSSGDGPALSGSLEPACLAFRPREGTYVDNVLEHGVGALNVDECRVGTSGGTRERDIGDEDMGNAVYGKWRRGVMTPLSSGRYPSNVILGHSPGCRHVGTSVEHVAERNNSESISKGRYGDHASFVSRPYDATIDAWECVDGCVVTALDAQSGDRPGGGSIKVTETAARKIFGAMTGVTPREAMGDSGGASRWSKQFAFEPGELEELQALHERFFYSPKASDKERGSENDHPTVKPMALMKYLATMIRPPRPGRILVPFCGSGSEMLGCMLAGWTNVVGIEHDPRMADVCRWRVTNAVVKKTHTEVVG